MTVEELDVYKKELNAAFSRELSEFKKNFLLIAAGILAFSITFIKEIIKLDSSNYLYYLFCSWGLIIFSIALMMLTYLKSAKERDVIWKQVDDFIIDDELYTKDIKLNIEQTHKIKTAVNATRYREKKELRGMRLTAVGTFIIGLISLALLVPLQVKEQQQKY
ncbi:MAG: hypothetical protein ABIP80_06395 [Ferruginibacter sp.]